MCIRDRILPTDISKMPHLDYNATLERWASVVGDESVDVRLFDRSELLDGDVGADFFSRVLGVDLADFESVSNENESLNVDGQLFLRTLNEHLPRFEGKRLSEKRGNIAKLVSEVAAGKGMLPTQAEAQRFHAQFAESNELLRQRWFPDRPFLFDSSFAKYPSSSADYQLAEEDAFRIFAALWGAKHAEVQDLKAKLRRQNKDS